MEPRPHERGNTFYDDEAHGAIQASMEPRPHERGNNIKRAQETVAEDIASMEPRPHERGNSCASRRRRTPTARFNGATSS